MARSPALRDRIGPAMREVQRHLVDARGSHHHERGGHDRAQGKVRREERETGEHAEGAQDWMTAQE